MSETCALDNEQWWSCSPFSHYFLSFGLFLSLEKTKNTKFQKCVAHIKNPACPTTQESALDSESNLEISIYLKTDRTQAHFRSGLVLHVALLQWDLVLSEVESSICLCPGWNELGICRVLQTVVERRVWLTAFDSALNGHGWAGLFWSEQHWPPRPRKEALFHLELERSTSELKITQQLPWRLYCSEAQSAIQLGGYANSIIIHKCLSLFSKSCKLYTNCRCRSKPRHRDSLRGLIRKRLRCWERYEGSPLQVKEFIFVLYCVCFLPLTPGPDLKSPCSQ